MTTPSKQIQNTIVINWFTLSQPVLWIILFSRLDDRGLILRNILNVSPPSVYSILRNGPSSIIQHCSRKDGGGRKELDSVIPEVLLTSRCWITAVPTAGAGALCLAWWLPCCGRGRELDSKLADVILKICLLTPSRWATTVLLPVLLELSSLTKLWTVDTETKLELLLNSYVYHSISKNRNVVSKTKLICKHRTNLRKRLAL